MPADDNAKTPSRLLHQASDLTVGEAYALQAEMARLRVERGEKVIGYKIGCTSPAVQRQLGIGEPIFARLFDAGCHDSGARLSHASYANLAIEGELALKLAADLSSLSPSEEECRDAIGSIFPVIELHHYSLCNSPSCVQELIASNGMHAGFVVTEPPHGDLAVRVRHLKILINGEPTDETAEPWTMGNPVASLLWLAARLREFGLHLSRGQIILTGSPMRLHPVAAGSRVVVEAPPLGRCSAVFEP